MRTRRTVGETGSLQQHMSRRKELILSLRAAGALAGSIVYIIYSHSVLHVRVAQQRNSFCFIDKPPKDDARCAGLIAYQVSFVEARRH